MDTTTFLQQVLGGEGRYCTFVSRTFDGDRKQEFYTSVEDLIKAAEGYDAQGYDAYFALATFGMDNSRRVANAIQLKSFFLDLDCGPTKDYPDQHSALKALQEFCKKTQLPKPVLINSGRGVHVYWVLDESLETDVWVDIASRLKKACAAHGLLADANVTADAARVLRLPGTHNHKGKPPAPVEFFTTSDIKPIAAEAFLQRVSGFGPALGKAGNSSLDLLYDKSSSIMQRAIANKESSFVNIMNRTVGGNGCEQLKRIVMHQETVDEPLWRAGLSITKFCVEGRTAAHNISKRHPAYDPEETNEKFDGIKGPYLCTKFDEYNPGVCKECPNWGKVKSPISLGMRVKEAEGEQIVVSPVKTSPNAPVQEFTIPVYPKPYFRGQNGGVYKRELKQDGEIEESMIYHNDLYVARRINDISDGESYLIQAHFPKDGVKEAVVPLHAIHSREEFKKAMGRLGVALPKMDQLALYVYQWANHLQDTTAADESRRQFGWSDDDLTSFVLGDQEYFKDRARMNAPTPSTSYLFPALASKGTLEGWKETMSFFERDGFELAQYIICNALASPLMQLLKPLNCAATHIYSPESGLGKSTMVMAGLTAWGDPTELLLSAKDTKNSQWHRSDVLHNLPLAIDELTDAAPETLSAFAYELTQGKKKGGMDRSGTRERIRGRPWYLTALITGQHSLVERIMMIKDIPDAEAQRVLEILATPNKQVPKHETDELSRSIGEDYGHAGPIFVRFVMNNIASVKDLVVKTQQKVDAAAGLEAKNRYWSAGAAVTLSAMIIAKRLGLLNYDAKKVFPWIVNIIKQNKNRNEEMGSSLSQVLENFINENVTNVLIIKSTMDLRKLNKNGADQLIVPDATPRMRLAARYEPDVKKLYIVPKLLKDYCLRNNFNYTSLVKDLEKEFSAKKGKYRLHKGTHLNFAPQDALVLDYNMEVPDEAHYVGD